MSTDEPMPKITISYNRNIRPIYRWGEDLPAGYEYDEEVKELKVEGPSLWLHEKTVHRFPPVRIFAEGQK